MSLLTGILFHATGACCAAVCFTPQKKLVGWSWQTYWLAQAVFCWLLLPLIVAYISIPNVFEVVSNAPKDAMIKSFALGTLYGIGGTAFGLAIRHVGFSLTYAIAVGISCILGTLLPAWIHGTLTDTLNKNGAGWVIAGFCIGVAGIAVCGLAGRLKELSIEKGNDGSKQYFSLSKGLPLCLLAGLFSAAYGFALDQGQPIADVAVKYGAGNWQGNIIYVFANSGAFLSTAIYCLYLHSKQKTFKEYKILANKISASALSVNFSMAVLTGVLWYSQFLFYGLGHTNMGAYKFISWAIHMIMLVLFSAFVGVILKEWAGSNGITIQALLLALFILILSVSLLTYGSYLGEH